MSQTTGNVTDSNQGPRRGRRKRAIFWLCLLVAVSLLSYGIVDFHFARPVGIGPAGPTVPREFFSEPWTQRAVKVIGLGDSITAGLGAASPSHSYFNRLLVNPKDEWEDMQGICLTAVLPNLDFENFAISGSESCWHRQMIDERLGTTEDAFGIVLMTTGGNDLIHNYGRSPPRACAMYGATLEQALPWIAEFGDRIRTMFLMISQRFPLGCEIYVGDIYDPTDGVGDGASIFLPPWPDGLAIHARYNEMIRSVAAEFGHVHVVPLHQAFLGHGAHCRQFWRSTYRKEDPHYWFYTNVEDPNDRGYDAIRRLFLNTMVQKSRLVPRPEPKKSG